MTTRSKAPARALAVIALVAGFVVLVALVSAALEGGDSSSVRERSSTGGATHQSQSGRKTPATYVVQNGDTLISIAHETGVPVAKIQRLNPEVDPQILISGEELKLR
jgi:LysM repeat protein